MHDQIHVGQRVYHAEHGAGVVDDLLIGTKRGGMRCRVTTCDVSVRLDADGRIVWVCPDDLREEADEDRR